MEAKQTPLIELLDRVPADIVLGIPGDEPVFPSYTNIPIGRLARQAAAELRRLAAVEAERDALRADAERYRWLRKYLSTKDMPILCGRGVRNEPDERDAIDAAIDAARGGGNG